MRIDADLVRILWLVIMMMWLCTGVGEVCICVSEGVSRQGARETTVHT